MNIDIGIVNCVDAYVINIKSGAMIFEEKNNEIEP